MQFLKDVVSNPFFVTAAVGWLVAQLLKTGIYGFLNRKFVMERLVGSGGMPSSHSATVCALATAAAYNYGAQSYEFAIAVILAIIVMYDAMGVRREAGIQANVINSMMKTFEEIGRGEFSTEKTLNEFVGHTPLQVLIGALLGIATATLMWTFIY